MAKVESKFLCDLSKPVQAQVLKGNVFSLDNLGSRISVLVYDNGSPATISGSVTANCILPDGSTVNVNGSLTTENGGSKAYVDIPQSCLLIPGILKIAIKVTASSVITTLAAIVANVYMTKTDNVITPSAQVITDWNAEISAAIASQDAAIAAQDDKIDDLKSAFNLVGIELSFDSETGKYIDVNGNVGTAVDSSVTDYIPVVEGYTYHLENLNLSGGRAFDAFDENKVKKATIVTGSNISEYDYTVPSGIAYIRATGWNTNPVKVFLDKSVKKIIEDLTENIEKTTEIREFVGENKFTTTIAENGKFVNVNGDDGIAADACTTEFIPIKYGQHIKLDKIYVSSARSVCVYKQDKTFHSKIISGSSVTSYEFDVPAGAWFVRATGAVNIAPTIKYENVLQDFKIQDIAHVATTGNDTTGDGTVGNPFATVNHALGTGASCVLLASGIYNEVIDLAMSDKHNISIANETANGIVTFIPASAVLTDTESSVSGYTKVHSASVSQTFNSNMVWIFQDGIADESTEISTAERHPLQRGYQYRCEDTVIIKCSASNLSDALTEIENYDGYKWFYNSGTLYFSRPSTVNSTNPICADTGNNVLFKDNRNHKRQYSLNISGIKTKYMGFNVDYLDSVVVADCKSLNSAYYGAFTFDLSVNSTFIRCEAARCARSTTGDGFNGHGVNTGEIFSKETTTTLIDCWSHDINDDGYSDHERCEMTIIGGLFEYCGKAGVTPSYGSHCTAYNVMSRKNYNGFFVVGNPESGEGGIGTQLLCFGCVAMNNTQTGSQMGNGFIAEQQNKMILSNCKAIGNRYGYNLTGNSVAEMYDCTAKDNTEAVKSGTGTFTIVNTELVS